MLSQRLLHDTPAPRQQTGTERAPCSVVVSAWCRAKLAASERKLEQAAAASKRASPLAPTDLLPAALLLGLAGGAERGLFVSSSEGSLAAELSGTETGSRHGSSNRLQNGYGQGHEPQPSPAEGTPGMGEGPAAPQTGKRCCVRRLRDAL